MDADVENITSSPIFRIVTTLKHNLFSTFDQHENGVAIQRWKEANSKLYPLHRQRLLLAALALSWEDVARKLQHEEHDDLAINLARAVEEVASQTTTSTPEPEKGFVRGLKVRVLIDRTGALQVEAAPIGHDQPISSLELDDDISRGIPQSVQPSWLPPNSRYTTVYIDNAPTAPSVFTQHKSTYRLPYDSSRARAGIAHSGPLEAEVILFNAAREVTEASLSSVYFWRDGRWIVPAASCGGMDSVTKMLALEGGFCSEGIVSVDAIVKGEEVWLSNAVRGFWRGKIVGSAMELDGPVSQ